MGVPAKIQQQKELDCIITHLMDTTSICIEGTDKWMDESLYLLEF